MREAREWLIEHWDGDERIINDIVDALVPELDALDKELAALEAKGHNSVGHCEKCWREAGRLYANGAYESHTAAYLSVMKQAEDAAAAQP